VMGYNIHGWTNIRVFSGNRRERANYFKCQQD